MISIRVAASREYDVLVGSGLIPDCGKLIKQVLPGVNTIALVSDSNVYPLYGKKVTCALEKAGCRVESFVLEAGEESKNLETYCSLLSFLASKHITRSDAVAALGGGVCGDLAGFAAATYQRGIPFVQLPTTLLAAVDSSVGGKTAVDLPEGKNLAGAFCQPHLVLCDTDTLATLPQKVYRDGCAEVIKYSILAGKDLFEGLRAAPVSADFEKIIEKCVSIKRDTVKQDEFDNGVRRLLNLGHSFGHAVEKCSSFSISHGSAVAIGMAMMARAAFAFGLCPKQLCDDIIGILADYSLPTDCPYSGDMLLGACLADKKMQGGTMNLVVPFALGDCRVVQVPAQELPRWLAAGGAK